MAVTAWQRSRVMNDSAQRQELLTWGFSGTLLKNPSRIVHNVQSLPGGVNVMINAAAVRDGKRVVPFLLPLAALRLMLY